ncbi:helix-turn-helix domain-containing protein [Desulfofundulus thermobenzoicus]|uniref:helix-turn-helix domain-containing protein n=1 Tax=Desulfofundulus thermobenzoicus TaxID=29376 RepID=UPI00128EF57F
MKLQVDINQIIVDEAIYPRSAVDPETVERYREALESGAKLPPLVLMPDNRLIDGRHRLEAYRLLGAEAVEAEIEEPADPDVRAVEKNLRHGRPLSKAELKEAARRWYGKRPVTEIAGLLGVTRQTVQNWVADLAAEREEARAEAREQALRMRAEGLTQEEVAEKLGISQQTISRWENQEYSSVKNLTLEYENISNASRCEEEYAAVKNLTHAYAYTENSSFRLLDSSLAAEREDARAEGLIQEEVAERLGLDRTTISKWENIPCESEKNFSPSHENNSNRKENQFQTNQPDEQPAVGKPKQTSLNTSLEQVVSRRECSSEKIFTPKHENNSSYGDGGKGQEIDLMRGTGKNEVDGNAEEMSLGEVAKPQKIAMEICGRVNNSVTDQEGVEDNDNDVFNYEPILTKENKPFADSLRPAAAHIDLINTSPVNSTPVQTRENNKMIQPQASQSKQSLRDNSEFRSSLEKVTSLCRELGGAIDRVLKNHSDSLAELAQENDIVDSGSLREVASKTADVMAYTMFRLSLEFLADRLSGLFDLLERKPPKFVVLKGGKSNGEKN